MQDKIDYTKQGGRYYRAMAWFYLTIIAMIVPVLFLLIIGLLNPFWFRDDYLRWLQTTIENVTRWRNYKMYALYLGTDPKMWHALKDEDATKVGKQP